MKLSAYSYYSYPELKEAKRIYLSNHVISYICPECAEEDTHDNRVPILTNNYDGSYYCHSLYCKKCSFESKEKMYSVNEIGDDYIDLTFNKEFFNIKVFEVVEREVKVN